MKARATRALSYSNHNLSVVWDGGLEAPEGLVLRPEIVC